VSGGKDFSLVAEDVESFRPIAINVGSQLFQRVFLKNLYARNVEKGGERNEVFSGESA